MKKISSLLSALIFGLAATAQVSITGTTLTYTQNFNTLDTLAAGSASLPAGWSIFEYGTSANVNNQYKAGTGSSTTGDTYSLGTAGNAERCLGSLAASTFGSQYGVKFVNNTGVPITAFTISYKGEQWRMGTTGRANPDSLRFLYSTVATNVADTAASWTERTDLLFHTPNMAATTGAQDGNAPGNFAVNSAAVNVAVPAGGTLIIKWVDLNITGTDDVLGIDDITLTFTQGIVNYHPDIIPVSPADDAIDVVPNTNGRVKMTFSRKVVKGSGSIYLKNETDQSTQVVAASAVDVVLNATGDTAFVNNLVFLAGKSYHLLIDSAAFDTASYHSSGIADTTRWNFTVQPSVSTVTSLNEQFEGSCPTGLPAGWTATSIAGAAVWHCSSATSNYACTISGGTTSASLANEDWLITPRLELSGQNRPTLAFKAKYIRAGLDLEVKYATDFTGNGDPNLATWADVPGVAFSLSDSNQFGTRSGALPIEPSVFIAFKYTCGAATPGNAREWSVDSVMVMDEPTGVHTINSSNLPVQVIGAATNGHVKIVFDMDKAAIVQFAVYDLAGRSVYRQSATAVIGKNVIVLTPQTLQSGMYIIRVAGDGRQGVTRTFIR